MPSKTSKDNGEAHKGLRQLAVEKTHGEGANPSLLGDPISLTTEVATEDQSDSGNPSETTADSTSAKNTETAKCGTTSDDNHTKRDPVDHDNGPSRDSGSVTPGRPFSKL
ncbi:hypothetical protein CONLIGDRAFT_680200 [Coniochaeta ligniaria NRRL 30616]|uniref:Uncharacterized protein n=1 Tax=Coniochaeta ligniaria NRRL 30616 TaxID=1408157 RepID=A0A1J7J7U0_9PEZI|nr:hypothetical protein CONLIGDRAFT_680200 [Coniochaeta ligniaria NRRL 30616]